MVTSSAKAQKTTQKAKRSLSLEDDASLRFVMDENGQVIYTSTSLNKFLETQQNQGEFTSEDDLTFQQNDQEQSFIDVKSGECDIAFAPADNKNATFHIDWIETKDQGKYLIATSLSEGEKHPSHSSLESFVTDITKDQDNKQATSKEPTQPRLKQDEHSFFLQMSSELQAVVENNGDFVRFNKNFERILEYADADLEQKNFIDIVHVDDRAHIRNALFTLSSQTQNAKFSPAIHFETRVVGKTGGVFWIDWQLKTVNDCIYALGRDVTDIKNNETALKRKEAQLKEAQTLANMGHWRWTIGEDIISCSDEIFKIFGLDESSFTPTINSIKSIVHRRDVGRVIQAFQRAIIEKRNYEIDFRIYNSDGDIRYLNCEGRCEYDDQEEVIALFGIMQDVTERLQNERALKEAKDSAENAYAAKSRFLANMSHELRTPLNAIIGFSEMMQRQLLGPIGTEKYLDYIAGIRESGEHLLDLISDILDMSRIEAGKYELDLEEINTSKLARLAVHMMEGRAVDSKINLSVVVENEDRILIADRRAVMQILLNLLSNAIKFTDEGGSVELKIYDTNKGVAFSVTDTGIGIPANKIANITRPFEQVENDYSRQYDGSGLGLAITKDLTELHGGKIEITSELGHGTTVTIIVPDHVSSRQNA